MFRRMLIRFFSMMLALTATVTGLSFSASAEELPDYTRWKQADPQWNQQEAWPADRYPDAPRRTLAEGGDQVTSLAMLLKQYEVVTGKDFTPWQCSEQLKEAAAFDEKGQLLWNQVQEAFPGFHFENRVEYSYRKAEALLKYGHPCIVEMKGRDGVPHYAALRSAAKYNVKIMDPGSENTRLTEAARPKFLYYFSLAEKAYEGSERAIFPAPAMEITQVAYESYSHAIANAIDLIPHGEMVAPFRCTVTFTDPSWGCVVLQSTGKVLYADGTLDYMTVSMVHSEDIGEMVRARKENRIICQGEPIYHAGGMGRGNPNAFREHVHMAAYRGHVSGVTDDGYYGCGDVYPFDAFWVDPRFTTEYPGRGEGYKDPDSFMYHKAPDDYRGLWKTLELSGSTSEASPEAAP